MANNHEEEKKHKAEVLESVEDLENQNTSSADEEAKESKEDTAQEEQVENTEQEPTAKTVTEEASTAEHPSDAQEEEEHEEDELEQVQEETDYSSYSKEQLLEEGKKLAKEENLNKAEREFKRVKEELDKLLEEEMEAAKETFVSEGGDASGFEYKVDEEVQAFNEAFHKARKAKREHFSKIKKEREDNLKDKRGIIEEIKNLIDANGSLEKVKQLQKQWKEIGSVPQPEAEDLYKSYSALLDRFYDQKSIEFDLKELDRKKNLEAKLELCDKAEALLEEENINEAIIQLGKLHEEFKAIGPVPREEQETVWQRFKAASDELYEKKREFAEVFKVQLKENMTIKQRLCLELEQYVAFDSDRIKEWNEKTKELIKIQEIWEKTGPLPREVAKDINKQFWGNFKAFFNNKAKFFEKLEAQRGENLKKKEELVKKAEELKESSDWAETAEKLKKLQEGWKNIGPVPEKYRESVYQQFKAACDFFFNRKRNRRAEQEKEFEINLNKKEAVCAKIDQLAEAGNFDLEEITKLKDEYFEVGFVPRKDINIILEKFLSSVEEYFENGPEEDRESRLLEFKAEIFKNAPSATKKLRRQEQGIRRKIDHLQSDIALWENNLEFFANSKTADKLKEDFSQKINEAQKELDDLKNQLRVIRSINESKES
ncbi:DUF349 domain-containing protein [Rapidithrix thailandica]|uniref:DUF349 domain-containing protein n=1 Tax=Rapidithrix thailandica TaxID=413964 RepID=A0AAW9S5W0_9BACT